MMVHSANYRPLLVGELNPYGSDPEFALYPAPTGSAGDRLCRIILGMRRGRYLREFRRVNLCAGEWSRGRAAWEAARLAESDGSRPGSRIILLGKRVTEAFGLAFNAFSRPSDRFLILPHPSWRCREWGVPGAVLRARLMIAEHCPLLEEYIGAAERPFRPRGEVQNPSESAETGECRW